jgi:hypothetical protein
MYLIAIWYILKLYDCIFSRMGIWYQERSGNPACNNYSTCHTSNRENQMVHNHFQPSERYQCTTNSRVTKLGPKSFRKFPIFPTRAGWPDWAKFRPMEKSFAMCSCTKITEVSLLGHLIPQLFVCMHSYLQNILLGYILDDFLRCSSGHPERGSHVAKLFFPCLLPFALVQGDQMSFTKNGPKRSQRLFCRNWFIALTVGERQPIMWTTCVILVNLPQRKQSPIGRKFVQSGRPVLVRLWHTHKTLVSPFYSCSTLAKQKHCSLPGLPDGLFSNQKSQLG